VVSTKTALKSNLGNHYRQNPQVRGVIYNRAKETDNILFSCVTSKISDFKEQLKTSEARWFS
jgi:hypothetical protein